MCLKGYPIAHVFLHPKSSALDPHSCAVKVANRLLYSSTWSWHTLNVCAALRLEIKSITRVDLCCDFVEFANGQLPSDFIHHYLRDTVSRDTESYIRRGSNKFCAIGKKVIKFDKNATKVKGEKAIDSVVSEFDYLRFGTRQSGCSVYLYNKSLELREKHGKPWIRRSWIDAGLIKESYTESETEPDVYRLELSIQSKGMTVRESAIAGDNFCSSEVVRKLVGSDFSTQLALESTFWAYQARYFSFVVARGQKYRKDMPALQLFEPEIAPNIKPCYLNRDLDAGRAEKNAAMCMQRLQRKISNMSTTERMTLVRAGEILANYGAIKYYDHLNDFSWTLDPEKEKGVSKQQKAKLQEEINKRIGNLMLCFADPRVAESVEMWECTKERERIIFEEFSDIPAWIQPPSAARPETIERTKKQARRNKDLEDFFPLEDAPF